MKKQKIMSKLQKAGTAQQCSSYALTRQQRQYEQASQLARSRLTDTGKALQAELGRMLTDVDFELDLNICNPTGLDNWLSEQSVLLAELQLPLEQESSCYLAIDHQAVHNMADLCLGGQLTARHQIEEKVEFSASETRICCRLLQKQAQALMQLLFNQHLPLSAHLFKQQFRPEPFQWLVLKVRLVLAGEAVSWLLWLPVALWANEPEEHKGTSGPVALLDWRRLPVRGRVEMARRQVRVEQLQAWCQGELLSVELFSSMQFQLEQQVLFHGKVAEEAGALMFQISDYAESGS